MFHISSQQEQDFILAFINFHLFAHACWMGLHDQIAEEMFEWTSGTLGTGTVKNRVTSIINICTYDYFCFVLDLCLVRPTVVQLML